MGANRFYPGTADALRFASSKVYIVTTKQSRFAYALLKELAGITLPPERIYGLGTGPKVEVLKKLQKMPEHQEHQGLTLHFVEDRLATLKNVIKEPELDNWNLYLEGLTVEGILETWIKLKPIVMEEWDENRDELIDLFGKVRDDCLQNDFSGWMGANIFYPGTADALRFASSKVYIVTTKQGRFVYALLKELAGITLPP
ncbi:uncharacterized protein DS421_14g474590 [Arachis hypogaea]|nr:uncharacterized protein DS421_14g474590 [Arachis hypogaea]